MSTHQDRTAHIQGYGNPTFPHSIERLNQLLDALPADEAPFMDALRTAAQASWATVSQKVPMQNGATAQAVVYMGTGSGEKRVRMALVIPFRNDRDRRDDNSLDRSAALHIECQKQLNAATQDAIVSFFVGELEKLVPTTV